MGEKTCTKCGKPYPETFEYFPKKTGGKNGLSPWCKMCIAEYKKLYYEANKEAIAEKGKLYRESNKEIITEKKKRYYENNKEAILKQHKPWREANKESTAKYMKQWCENNKELIAEKKKQYREDNKETIFEYMKQYYKTNKMAWREYSKKRAINNPESLAAARRKYKKNNPDRAIMDRQKRRARERHLPNTLTDKQWETCKAAFNNKCAYCGETKKLTIEHFIPLVKFGELTINNVVPACPRCNASKGAKDFKAWYPTTNYYSKQRERKILKYLNYDNGIQQLALL